MKREGAWRAAWLGVGLVGACASGPPRSESSPRSETIAHQESNGTEREVVVGQPEVLPDGTRLELLGAGYLHAPGGANVSTATVRVTFGTEARELTLGREHPGPLRFERAGRWRVAVVSVVAGQRPSRATLALLPDPP